MDRILFFEHARKAAEASYTKNPLDAENNINESKDMIQVQMFSRSATNQQIGDIPADRQHT
ncbi:unnamed protein product [Camellia sinensis]